MARLFSLCSAFGILFYSYSWGQTYSATGLPVTLNDGTSSTCWASPSAALNTTVNVPLTGTIIDPSKVTISFAISHAWIGDVRVQLSPPSGSPVINLIDRLGS
ncbi:MAG: hypothetical protein AAB316_19005, partial [Bacteroidota bacterium]